MPRNSRRSSKKIASPASDVIVSVDPVIDAPHTSLDAALPPAPPDAPPMLTDATDAPSTALVTVDPIPDAPPAPVAAPPARTAVGGPRTLNAATIDARLTFNGRILNGAPILPTRASRIALHVDANGHSDATPAVLTPADAPRLLALAATMLASAGSTIAAPELIPSAAFDDLAETYLSNRVTATRTAAGYFASNRGVDSGASPLDRMLYPVRIAERAVYAYHALTNGSRPAFNGGYGSRESAELRRDSLTAHVSARF